jgi:Na+-driven multidrug efflux pump
MTLKDDTGMERIDKAAHIKRKNGRWFNFNQGDGAVLKDLTSGSETKVMIRFAIPMIIGNLFQQLYNIADTVIVGKFIGPGALAAVGSSYSLMVFLTSIIMGLCMGSGVVLSMAFGAGKMDRVKSSIFTSFWFIALVTVIINISALVFIDGILVFTRIPADVLADTKMLSEFKAGTTQEIIECTVKSIMMPLFTDHLLREANHFIYLLQSETT